MLACVYSAPAAFSHVVGRTIAHFDLDGGVAFGDILDAAYCVRHLVWRPLWAL